MNMSHCFVYLLFAVVITTSQSLAPATTKKNKYNFNRISYKKATIPSFTYDETYIANRDERWPLKPTALHALRDQFPTSLQLESYLSLCIRCTFTDECDMQPLLNCRNQKYRFCVFPTLTSGCDGAFKCTLNYSCQKWGWEKSVCYNNFCICEQDYVPNFVQQRCQHYSELLRNTPITTTPRPTTEHYSTTEQYSTTERYSTTTKTFRGFGVSGYGAKCDFSSECKWVDLYCISRKCVCRGDLRPNFNTKECEGHIDLSSAKVRNNNYVIGIGISAIFIIVCISICICISRRNSECQSNRNSRPIGVAGTSSTLELLGELNDLPPDYSNIYMIGPRRNEDHDNHNKLPTYEEAVRLPEWSSQTLYAAEETNPRPSGVTTSDHTEERLVVGHYEQTSGPWVL